jgi:hypothetical protein
MTHIFYQDEIADFRDAFNIFAIVGNIQGLIVIVFVFYLLPSLGW